MRIVVRGPIQEINHDPMERGMTSQEIVELAFEFKRDLQRSFTIGEEIITTAEIQGSAALQAFRDQVVDAAFRLRGI